MTNKELLVEIEAGLDDLGILDEEAGCLNLLDIAATHVPSFSLAYVATLQAQLNADRDEGAEE